jgi:hypothetical protein
MISLQGPKMRIIVSTQFDAIEKNGRPTTLKRAEQIQLATHVCDLGELGFSWDDGMLDQYCSSMAGCATPLRRPGDHSVDGERQGVEVACQLHIEIQPHDV